MFQFENLIGVKEEIQRLTKKHVPFLNFALYLRLAAQPARRQPIAIHGSFMQNYRNPVHTFLSNNVQLADPD